MTATITILKVVPGINNWQVVTYAATNDALTYCKVEGAAFPLGDVQTYADAHADELFSTAQSQGQTVLTLIITAYREAQFRLWRDLEVYP